MMRLSCQSYTKQAKTIILSLFLKEGMSNTCCSAWKVLAMFSLLFLPSYSILFFSFIILLTVFFIVVLLLLLPLLSLDRCFVTISRFHVWFSFFPSFFPPSVYLSTCLRNIILFIDRTMNYSQPNAAIQFPLYRAPLCHLFPWLPATPFPPKYPSVAPRMNHLLIVTALHFSFPSCFFFLLYKYIVAVVFSLFSHIGHLSFF